MDISSLLPFADFGRSIVTLVFDAGLFAKFILLTLFVLSVISWAIIWDRSRLYTKLKKGDTRLQSALASKGLNVSADTVRQCLPSIQGALVLETKRVLAGAERAGGDPADVTGSSDSTRGLNDLLERRAMAEISEMEKYLIFLATTASVSPFLGLLGTVWGIMSSFLSMGLHGTASIEVIGPGIAEALVTTIAGLGAAIPALVGYNLLIRYVHRQETRVDLFISRIVELIRSNNARNRYSQREKSYEKKPV
jgi:biopolymer transport protein TolQ